MYWGNTRLPWLQWLSIRSFARSNPDWKAILWVPPENERCPYDTKTDMYESIGVGNFMDQVGVEIRVADTYALTGAVLDGYELQNAWRHTAMSDALRLHLLHDMGGIWSDVDVFWFGKVEDSSLWLKDGKTVGLWWRGGDGVYNSLISAEVGAPAIKRLLDDVRRISPIKQAPGGQSPFGAEMWFKAFGQGGGPSNVPGHQQSNPGDFHERPYSIAAHVRGARLMWGSMDADNYKQLCADLPDVSDAIKRAIGGG